MKPSAFSYHRPRQLDEALDLLATLEDVAILAGGQSLMPAMNFRLATPAHVVDINCINELSHIRESDGIVEFGAMVRQSDIEFSNIVAKRLPVLYEAIRHVGHRQTRNRGTIGGSLCLLDPSAELPTLAMAMDAEVTVASVDGERVLPFRSFALGLMSNALQHHEMLTKIRIRPWRNGHGWSFVEFARRHGDFAIVSAMAMLSCDRCARVSDVSLTLGGFASLPLRLSRAEAALKDLPASPSMADFCQDEIESAQPLDDPTYPAWFRRRLANGLIRKAISAALARAEDVESFTDA